MKLIYQIELSLKWYKKLTGRFLNIAFIQTIFIVFATIFSQTFMLLSTMTPLKIVMLLGSDKIPGFFPDSWQSIDKNMLIIYLAIASIGFFILHIFFEKIITLHSIIGSNKVLQNNKKIILFENQDVFAQKAYTKLSKSLSNIIFFILSLVGIGIVYLPLSFMIIFYILSIYIVFSILFKKDRSAKVLNEGFNSSIDLLKGVGFFVIFAFILGGLLADFYAPKTIVIILSVLLVRQMFSKLSSAIKDIKSLYRDRLKINSLFFFKDTKIQITHDKKDPFWSLLNYEDRRFWIEDLLSNVLDNKITYVSSQYYNVNIKNVIFLKVLLIDCNNNTYTYLLKLFNKNISSQAIHEATILQENIDDFFSLPFIGSSNVREFHCNIFYFPDIKPIDNFKDDNILIRIKIMKITPPKELLKRYDRSHPYLHNRLNIKMIDKLYLIVDSDNINMIKDFENNFDDILQNIKEVPLQLINPMITKFSLVKTEDNFVLLHWAGWKIDSLGTDFPISLNALNTLRDELDINHVNIDDVILVSLMSQFEKYYNSENFTGVIEIIPKILEYMKNAK
jgi:hypothetical protein